jgi:hypothetical protein
MKTKSEWEKEITVLTTKIITEFPELVKYIEEIPIMDSDQEGISLEHLEGYYLSLQAIITKYSKTHLENDGSSKNK